MTRITSSIRSSSIRRSKRQLGGVTVRRPGSLREREAESRQHLLALRLRDGHADHLGGAVDAQRHRLGFRQVQHLVVHRTGFAAADVDDELRDALDVLYRQAGSTPRSKRWPASVEKLKRRERPATASGHQNAAST